MHATHTIAVYTYKGGTGKTSTAHSLAVALALAGARVLVVDLDAQANLTQWIGADPSELSLWHVIRRDLTLPAAIQPSGVEGLDVVAAHPEMTGAEGALRGGRSPETWLRRQIDTLTKGWWGWVIFDCAPGLGILTEGALAAADWALIPCAPRVLESGGIVQALDLIDETRTYKINTELKVLGVLPVMVDKRVALTKEILDQMAESLGEHLLETRIPIDARLAEAPGHRQSIFEYAPRSRSAKAYGHLVQEIENRVKAEESR